MTVDHEIKAEYFEVIAFSAGVDETEAGAYCVGCDLLQFRVNLCLKVIVLPISRERIQISLKLGIVKFVSWFVFTIVAGMLLYGIISQMNIAVCNFLQSPGITRCSNVSILVPITPQFSVVHRQQHIGSYIEFAVVVEKRVYDVLLQNQRFVFA